MQLYVYAVSHDQEWFRVAGSVSKITGKEVRCRPEDQQNRPLRLEVVGGDDEDFEELVWRLGNVQRVSPAENADAAQTAAPAEGSSEAIG